MKTLLLHWLHNRRGVIIDDTGPLALSAFIVLIALLASCTPWQEVKPWKAS